MSNVSKKLKKSIKSVQRLWGKKTRIGNFVLEVDPENSQPYILKKHPEHGTNLIRLARALEEKYSRLLILDIGANFGDTAAMLLSSNPNYTIVCIEGDRPTFKLLSENFKHHNKVRLHKHFLGEFNGSKVASPSKLGGSLELNDKESAHHETVNIINLDSFMAKNPTYTETKLLKIDTDGYDNQIIRGVKEYLIGTKPAQNR